MNCQVKFWIVLGGSLCLCDPNQLQELATSYYPSVDSSITGDTYPSRNMKLVYQLDEVLNASLVRGKLIVDECSYELINDSPGCHEG
jgi:hypothetical protein